MPGPAFLTGESVTLCTIEEEDVDFLHRWINDDRIWRPIGSSTPLNRAQETSFYEDVVSEGDGVQLLVTVDETPVGTVGLESIDLGAGVAEVGYWIVPERWGEGIATEATRLIVGYAFDQRRLHKVTARAYGFNDGSKRVLEKVGFVEEGVQREQTFLDGEYHDTHWYGLLVDDWRNQ